jgi:FAD synthase
LVFIFSLSNRYLKFVAIKHLLWIFARAHKRNVLTLGTFDGVHIGLKKSYQNTKIKKFGSCILEPVLRVHSDELLNTIDEN